MGKVYLEKDVLTAALERLEFIFNNFDNVYFSCSGGKDSSVMVQLANIKAKEMNKKFDVLFMDLEAQYQMTLDHIGELKQLSQVRDFYHCCLVWKEDNAMSMFETEWHTWEPGKEDIWVREMPEGVINRDNCPFDFYYDKMDDFVFTEEFAKWYKKKYGGKVATGVGLRANESLNRFRTMVSDKITRFNNKNWTTKIEEDIYNFYPLYDWRTEDIWGAIFKLDFTYNKAYELMLKAGMSIHEARIDYPYGQEQRKGIELYKLLEPDTWEKVVNRVSGVGTGDLYSRTSLLGHLGTSKPKHLSWEEYTIFLLESIGLYAEEIMLHYKEKIERIIWWHETHLGDKLTDSTDKNRKGDRNHCSWEMIAKAIEKNDFWMRSMSFSYTKRGYAYLEQLQNRYAKMFDMEKVNTQQEKAKKALDKRNDSKA